MTFEDRILVYLDIPIPSYWWLLPIPQRIQFLNGESTRVMYEKRYLRKKTSLYEIALELFNGELVYRQEIWETLQISPCWAYIGRDWPMGVYVPTSAAFHRVPRHIGTRILKFNIEKRVNLCHKIESFLDIPIPEDYRKWFFDARRSYLAAGKYVGIPRDRTSTREIVEELFKGNLKMRTPVRKALNSSPHWQRKHLVELGGMINHCPGWTRIK